MRNLLHLMMLLSLTYLVTAGDASPQAQPQQTLGVSSIIVVDRPLELSTKVYGFIHAENQEIVLHFDVSEIVAVHKFIRDQVPQSVIVFTAPMAAGRQDTFILIPETIMTFDKVLEFVDMARKTHLLAK